MPEHIGHTACSEHAPGRWRWRRLRRRSTNAFLWSGTIGTLILLVAYLLATVGMTLLVFVRRKMPSVPMWQIMIPVAAVLVLGYTLYRNVYPYPAGDGVAAGDGVSAAEA